jgi:crotonobetainyl-CoA:carnitine CoA-transferase CaiB-like acyl-CoA transferase
MLKVYNVHDRISIDGAKWREIGLTGYIITDKELSEIVILDHATFAETREYLDNNWIDGMRNQETFWRRKPIIEIRYQDAWDWVDYRRFNTLSYKRKYKEWKDVSMEWLMKHASADQFIQYLKERGITACPMNF